jgi:hypothetical protein
MFFDQQGNPVRLQPDGLRVDKDGVSSNWVQYFLGCWSDQILRTRYIMVRTMTIRKTGRLAVARVGRLEDAATTVSRVIWVEHHPEPCNDAHSLIVGDVLDNDDGLTAILAGVFELRPAFLSPIEIDDVAGSIQDNYSE